MFDKFEGTSEFFPDVESRCESRQKREKERVASRRLHSVILPTGPGTKKKLGLLPLLVRLLSAINVETLPRDAHCQPGDPFEEQIQRWNSRSR